MKWLQLTCVIFAVAQCLFMCCESSPAISSSVDCGSFQSVKPSQQPRGMSLVSSMLRRNFASSYKRTYTCWRASNITEVPMYASASSATEWVIQFSVDKSSLENITGAKLTLSWASLGVQSEAHKDQVGVKGTMSGLDVKHHVVPDTKEETSLTNRGSNNQNVITFDVLEFIRNVYRQEKVIEKLQTVADVKMEAGDGKIPVKFYIARICLNENVASCPTIFDTTFHTPSLRVFYV